MTNETIMGRFHVEQNGEIIWLKPIFCDGESFGTYAYQLPAILRSINNSGNNGQRVYVQRSFLRGECCVRIAPGLSRLDVDLENMRATVYGVITRHDGLIENLDEYMFYWVDNRFFGIHMSSIENMYLIGYDHD